MSVIIPFGRRGGTARKSSMKYACRLCGAPAEKPPHGGDRRCIVCKRTDTVYCTTNKMGAKQVWACIYCCSPVERPDKRDKTRKHCDKEHAVACFKSQWELTYWSQLRLREKVGQIRNLTFQPRFNIIVGGMLIADYVGDASFFEGDESVVIDCKPSKYFMTEVYKLKKKLVEAIYKGVKIREVFKS